MKNKKINIFSRAVFFVFLILVVVLAYFIVQPFVSALLGAIVLSYIFFPIFRKLKEKTKKENLSALLTILIIILVFAIPIIFISHTVIKESYFIYTTYFSNGEFKGRILNASENCEKGVVCFTAKLINEKIDDPQVKSAVAQTIVNALNAMVAKGSEFLITLPEKILSIFILLFTSFYLLKRGPDVLNFVKSIVPLKEKDKKYVLKQLNDVVYATIYGSIIVALAQGLVAGVGYFFFGVEQPIMWAVITFLAALIPMIGTFLAWGPLSAMILLNGAMIGDNTMIAKGIGLLIYGTLIIGTIDNILRPKLIGDRARVNPVIVLIGALGGLKLFGVFGIFIGPIVLAVMITLLQIYIKEKGK
jgi:predicted PurR-regulated permease PerM